MPIEPKGPIGPIGDHENDAIEKSKIYQPERRPLNIEAQSSFTNTLDAFEKLKSQGKVISYGEEYLGKVISYGQQLQFELKLRGWTQEELAKKIGVDVRVVREWETNRLELNRTDRRKLIEFLGRNDYYLSSEVLDKGDLRIRVVQLELTARDFTTIISALTEFHTEFWLIQEGRFADLEEYTRTQDSLFMEKANLVIDNLTTNSPALLTLLTDPGTATTAVTSIVTLAVALQKAVDVIAQTWKKIQDIDQEHQKRKLEMQQKQFEMEQKQLEAKRKQIEWEQQQLEEQLTRKQKEIESTITMMVGIANMLRPGIDEQTRGIIMQAITPVCWKLLDRE